MSSPLDEFLGYGILSPFQRDQKNDFANDGGRRLVQSAMDQILGTDGQGEQTNGEIPWRPEFGSKFYLLKHRKGHFVKEAGRQYALDSIARWEPRISITNVEATFDRKERAASFRIFGELINANNTSNQVVIEDLQSDVKVG